MIKINSLNKYFNRGKQNEIHVIDNVNLTLPDKGMVAIFGKSGCGKTTLLNVIGGLDGFNSGSVFIENSDIRSNTDSIRNKYIGYIFQNYNLNKSESCFDNVADALRLCGIEDSDKIETRVMAALSNVGMDKYRSRTPDTLSGGQQQRIAIARAIVKNPRIILADEPTGNLDESNTVMIMDLLRQIARDHLVLLVTHEANLVDFYCDMIIELSDGQVMSVRENQSAGGYAARDKNHIYLGELEKTELSLEQADVEYYGEAPASPIKLRLVNNGGKLYVRIDTPGVQVLDEFSEIKLKDGVYVSHAEKNSVSEGIDMSSLPPLQCGKRLGRLFSFRSSVKSGYNANFKKRKLGKKILRGCMCMFAAVVVLMTSIFGTAFEDIISADKAYNHNVFYVYTPNGDVSSKLSAAVGSAESGIDYIRLMNDVPSGDQTLKFYTGFFETFVSSPYDETFRTNAVLLDTSLTKDMKLLSGERDGLDTSEMLISSSVADELLKLSSLGYIEKYDDLLGLITSSAYVDGLNLRIAGVVECDEPAVYLTETAMAKYVVGRSNLQVKLGVEHGLDLPEGETVLAVRNGISDTVKYPSVGEKLAIRGRTLTVTKIIRDYADYREWISGNGIKKIEDPNEYFAEVLSKEADAPARDSNEWVERLNTMYEERYFEYYDYYYDMLDEFIADRYFFSPNEFNVWLAVKKKIEGAKFLFAEGDYFKAYEYKKQYGIYPSLTEFYAVRDQLPEVYDIVENCNKLYLSEFDTSSKQESFNGMSAYFVSDADYIGFSKVIGETHETATMRDNYISDGYYGGDVYYAVEYDYAYTSITSSDVMVDSGYGGAYCYTVVHSNTPKATEAFLSANFGDIETESKYLPSILYPDDVFDNIISNYRLEIITSLVTMTVVLAVMSVCMFFIMRSSLMNRIKEVGIYRAIGVSQRNLVFKFLVETLVLTTLTVFIGYLITSGFLFACLGASPFVSQIFYYPLWLAAAVLVILYGLSLLCGTLPILSLLRKTPSAILAKYDI